MIDALDPTYKGRDGNTPPGNPLFNKASGVKWMVKYWTDEFTQAGQSQDVADDNARRNNEMLGTHFLKRAYHDYVNRQPSPSVAIYYVQ